MSPILRVLAIPALAAAALLPLHATESPDVFALVQKSCAGCHNATVKSGDVDLATLRTAKTFEEDREIWEKVVEKLELGQMPPPGLPRPDAETITAVTRWLESEFARQDRAIKPEPGRVAARRLNRAEYNNTIRDLLGIDIRPADNFPADTAAHGFDNISDALNLSPGLLENYVDAAERAVRTALFGPERMKPAAVHYSAPVRINDSRGTLFAAQGSVPLRRDGVEHAPFRALHPPLSRSMPSTASAWCSTGTARTSRNRRIPRLFIDGKLIQEFEVDATDLEGQIVECRARVTAGEHLLSETYLRNYHGLPPKL